MKISKKKLRSVLSKYLAFHIVIILGLLCFYSYTFFAIFRNFPSDASNYYIIRLIKTELLVVVTAVALLPMTGRYLKNFVGILLDCSYCKVKEEKIKIGSVVERKAAFQRSTFALDTHFYDFTGRFPVLESLLAWIALGKTKNIYLLNGEKTMDKDKIQLRKKEYSVVVTAFSRIILSLDGIIVEDCFNTKYL